MSPKSQEWLARAERRIPGGVNSPVRAFRAVGGFPPFIERGAGSHLTDVDGRAYIDYVGSWGPLILGHAHPDIVAAVTEQMAKGTHFSGSTDLEIKWGQWVQELIPSAEKVRTALPVSSDTASLAEISISPLRDPDAEVEAD